MRKAACVCNVGGWYWNWGGQHLLPCMGKWFRFDRLLVILHILLFEISNINNKVLENYHSNQKCFCRLSYYHHLTRPTYFKVFSLLFHRRWIWWTAWLLTASAMSLWIAPPAPVQLGTAIMLLCLKPTFIKVNKAVTTGCPSRLKLGEWMDTLYPLNEIAFFKTRLLLCCRINSSYWTS